MDGFMADDQYGQLIATAGEKLLLFLQTFESVQENMHIGLEASQERLREVVGDMFPTLQSQLAQSSPPEVSRRLWRGAQALRQCGG